MMSTVVAGWKIRNQKHEVAGRKGLGVKMSGKRNFPILIQHSGDTYTHTVSVCVNEREMEKSLKSILRRNEVKLEEQRASN